MKHTYGFAFMIVLMSSILFACSSQSLTVQTTTTATPAQSISVNPDWITSIDSAKEVVKNSSETTDLYLVDILGSYDEEYDIVFMSFVFINNENALYKINMLPDGEKNADFYISSDIVILEGLNNIQLRKKLIPLIGASPVDILNKLRASGKLSNECFKKVINMATHVPEQDSKYPHVPYWTFIIPSCENEYITLDVNALNGDILDELRIKSK